MYSDPEVDAIKRRLNSGSSSSSRTPTDFSVSDEMLSLSDDDPICTILGNNVPILSLPTLYEDEENPVTVKITCKKCLDMEAILRNFAEIHLRAFEACKEKNENEFWEVRYFKNSTTSCSRALYQPPYALSLITITYI